MRDHLFTGFPVALFAASYFYNTVVLRALKEKEKTFVLCRVSPHLAVVQISTKVIGADSLDYITLDQFSAFTIIQSRPHEIWARFMASSMKDDLRYTPSDCFETFPFPDEFEDNSALEEIGRAYYDFRAEVMVRNNEGLTKTYNRFHNPGDNSNDVKGLRELHDRMDRAVLDAYEWSDLCPSCEFFPEFEEDEDTEDEPIRKRPRKYRYRWPDEIHDEVLARLLALNHQRGAVPELEAVAPATEKQPTPKTKKSKKTDESNLLLFGPQIK